MQFAQIGRPSHLSLRPVTTAKKCVSGNDQTPTRRYSNASRRVDDGSRMRRVCEVNRTYRGRKYKPSGCGAAYGAHSSPRRSRHCGSCWTAGTAGPRVGQDVNATKTRGNTHPGIHCEELRCVGGRVFVFEKPLGSLLVGKCQRLLWYGLEPSERGEVRKGV